MPQFPAGVQGKTAKGNAIGVVALLNTLPALQRQILYLVRINQLKRIQAVVGLALLKNYAGSETTFRGYRG
jgi:hypothetical protein